MSERSWKRRLFRKNRVGVYEWRGWTAPVLRLGRWELSLTQWTHQVPRDEWRVEG